jgi:asparagine synthase (glutamine-hydrolysing)
MAALLAGASTLDAVHSRYRSIFTPGEIRALLTGWGMTTAEQDAGEHEAADDWGISFDEVTFPTGADRIAWLETVNFLGNQLLRDSDTFGMAAGVEIRVPLTDSTLLDAVAPIASSIRLAPGKTLLKRAVHELPEWLTALPKRGFTFPFERWLDDSDGRSRGFLTSWRLPSVPPGLDIRDWNRRWALLVLGEWLERHLGLTLYAKSSAA